MRNYILLNSLDSCICFDFIL